MIRNRSKMHLSPALRFVTLVSVTTTRAFSAISVSRLKDLSWFQMDLDSSSAAGATFPVYNPAVPSEIVSKVPNLGKSQVSKIIEQSHKALPQWRDCTAPSYRGSLLTKWSTLIQQHKHDIAAIMTLESGKPLAESIGEVNYGTSFLDYYAAEIMRPTGTLLPAAFSTPNGVPRGQSMAMQQAVGVCGLITPWNFPIAMITRKVGPALAAGCTAIIKPSELTPITALLLQDLAEKAGIPPHVLQTITTDRENTPEVGEELCSNPLVRKISFTGSTAVGKLLMKTASSTVKRMSLELGGNAPFIVFDDANLDQAVSAAMASKFRNAGQTCVCADRFLVHAAIHDEFCEKLTAKIKELVVGNGMKDGVTMGPVISSDACDRIHEKVVHAIEAGAKCLVGGSKLQHMGTHFFEPTLLTNVPEDADIWHTETFGPVAAVRSFETEEEAIQIANNSPVGLASYFLTNDLGRTFRVAKALETGIVGVNDGIISTCSAPFGGVKESGLGREGGVIGMQEYLETKYVFINY